MATFEERLLAATESSSVCREATGREMRGRSRKIAAIILAGAAVTILPGCSNMSLGTGTKAVIGTLAGGAAGGYAGSFVGSGKGKLAAVAVGTLFGALIGNSTGNALDKSDEAHVSKAEEKARRAKVGQTVRWSNPKNGHRGTVTPVRETVDEAGRPCREYETGVSAGNNPELATYTTYRDSSGLWVMVSENADPIDERGHDSDGPVPSLG